ncbi:uncharacterized protein LOC134177080 [Corticium candelabrum]|uniref:uncharacterized protein LOC134177080 n=1 Tax=Corticium candelabrum TaxID=121492 RepID=UPI002E26C0FA|nr:uncharacterized protein LOC134177080 [Corticium candelabrum]
MSACSRIQSRDRWATQDWPRSLPCGWLIATIVFTKMLLTGAVRIFPSTDIYIEDKSRFNPISIYCFVPYKGDTTWKYNGNLRKHYSDWSKCENSKIRAFCKNYINIPTFHEDYVGRYTCCDLHEGTNASINVGGNCA